MVCRTTYSLIAGQTQKSPMSMVIDHSTNGYDLRVVTYESAEDINGLVHDLVNLKIPEQLHVFGDGKFSLYIKEDRYPPYGHLIFIEVRSVEEETIAGKIVLSLAHRTVEAATNDGDPSYGYVTVTGARQTLEVTVSGGPWRIEHRIR